MGFIIKNVSNENGLLKLSVTKDCGYGSQIESQSSNYSYGEYSASIKSPGSTNNPEGTCSGFSTIGGKR